MQPKFKLNFSYNNPPAHHQSLHSSRLNQSTVVLNNTPQPKYGNAIVSHPEQKVRTMTLSTG